MTARSLSERLNALAAKYGMMYDDLELMSEAAALARRVEAAPLIIARAENRLPVRNGKLVRLVVEEPDV